MSADRYFDAIALVRSNFDSNIGSDILFSVDAPDYVFSDGPLPDLWLFRRESQPSLNQIVFSIDFAVRWTVSNSGTKLGPADNESSTIQVRANTLINSNGKAIATVLSFCGIRPDLHRPVLDRICMESRSMLADISNRKRLTFTVVVEIVNGVTVSVMQVVPEEESLHVASLEYVKGRGSKALKRIIYVGNSEGAKSSECPICLRDLESGTELTERPCSHVQSVVAGFYGRNY